MSDSDIAGLGAPDLLSAGASAAADASGAGAITDPLQSLVDAATERTAPSGLSTASKSPAMVPKFGANANPNPAAAAQRVSKDKAVEAAKAEGGAEASADLETRLRAEFQATMQNTLAVDKAITAEALRLHMDPDHLALFEGCKTVDEVSNQSAAIAAYLGKVVRVHAANMIEQMKAEGYTLVKNGAAATAADVVRQTNGAANGSASDPAGAGNDPFAPMSPLHFAVPLANASKPGNAPGRPGNFQEAAEMVRKGLNIA